MTAAELGFAQRNIAAETEECWRQHQAQSQTDLLSIPGIGRAMQVKMDKVKKFGIAVKKATRNPRNQRGNQKVFLTKEQNRQLMRDGIMPNVDLRTVTLTRRQHAKIKEIRTNVSTRKAAVTT